MASSAIVVSAVLVISCGQNHTDADDRYTHANTVGVSNSQLYGDIRAVAFRV